MFSCLLLMRAHEQRHKFNSSVFWKSESEAMLMEGWETRKGIYTPSLFACIWGLGGKANTSSHPHQFIVAAHAAQSHFLVVVDIAGTIIASRFPMSLFPPEYMNHVFETSTETGPARSTWTNPPSFFQNMNDSRRTLIRKTIHVFQVVRRHQKTFGAARQALGNLGGM